MNSPEAFKKGLQDLGELRENSMDIDHICSTISNFLSANPPTPDTIKMIPSVIECIETIPGEDITVRILKIVQERIQKEFEGAFEIHPNMDEVLENAEMIYVIIERTQNWISGSPH